MAMVFIAHSKVERFEDPESSPYDRYSPRLHKHAAALVSEWCDAVLFATRNSAPNARMRASTASAPSPTRIGKDGGERILRCVGGPSCVAKTVTESAEELPLSWAAFLKPYLTINPRSQPTWLIYVDSTPIKWSPTWHSTRSPRANIRR